MLGIRRVNENLETPLRRQRKEFGQQISGAIGGNTSA